MRRKSKASIVSRGSTVEKKSQSNISDVTSVSGEYEQQTDEYEGILPHPRTDELLEDYRQFKAARVIQAAARCWYARLIYQRKKRSAIIIQHAWRGVYYPRWYYRFLENTLQQRIEQHYYDSATKIQSWWRGWWVRMHVHDHYALMREQLRLAEELLQCVAYKLHHLMRTKQIPGIYSMRNSQALSKIEKLIAAFTFKQYSSGNVTNPDGSKSKPFDVEQIAKNPKCVEFFKQKDLDARMHAILKIYNKSMEEDATVKAYHSRASKRKLKPVEPPASFCSDIIRSLNRWDILRENNIQLSIENIKDPEKLDAFLTEVRSIYDRMVKTPCVCYRLPY